MFRNLIVFAILFSNVAIAQAILTDETAHNRDTSPKVENGGKPTPVHDGFSDRNARYALQAGDTFEAIFEFSPEFTQTVTVQPDGFVTLKGAGDIKLAGLTTPEAVTAIRNAYSRILRAPVVTISLKEIEKPSFVADGQVNRPGKYPLRANTTLEEAIAIAGGINDSAKHSQVLLFHRVSSQWMEAKVINLKQMFKRKDLSEDVVLQPGDLIYVPQSRISKFRRYIPAPGIGMSVGPPL